MNVNLASNFDQEGNPAPQDLEQEDLLNIKKEIARIYHALGHLKDHAHSHFGATSELTIKIEDFFWQARRWAERLEHEK